MQRTSLKFCAATLILIVGVMVDGTTPAGAYCASNMKWPTGAGHQVIAASNDPAWDSFFSASVAQWNSIPGSTWHLTYRPRGTYGPPTSGGWIYYTSSAPTSWAGAPGLTWNNVEQYGTLAGTIQWTNTYLNSDWHWNDTGVMNESTMKADVRTVVTHELGHWLNLAHPSSCGAMTSAEVAAVMNPSWVKKWAVTADDRAGAAAMY